jgi:hypothetical protein
VDRRTVKTLHRKNFPGRTLYFEQEDNLTDRRPTSFACSASPATMVRHREHHHDATFHAHLPPGRGANHLLLDRESPEVWRCCMTRTGQGQQPVTGAAMRHRRSTVRWRSSAQPGFRPTRNRRRRADAGRLRSALERWRAAGHIDATAIERIREFEGAMPGRRVCAGRS